MDYKNINDYEQLYLVCENNEDSRDILFRKYQPLIGVIAKKYYEMYKNKGICFEDLMQEGNIGLMKAIDNFSDRENTLFYTFSTVCVERQIVVYCKKYLSRKNNILNDAVSIDLLIEKKSNLEKLFKEDLNSLNNPNIYLEIDDVYERLIEFKNSLPIIQSLVFELRYNGFRYKEISKLLDIPISNVDSNLHSCRLKFKKKFGI